MITIIILTRTKWHEPPRIRHEVARQLARYFRVLFVETPTQWQVKDATHFIEVEKNIIRCSLSNRMTFPVKIQHYNPLVHLLVGKYLLKELKTLLWNFRDSKHVLINFNYDMTEVMNSEEFDFKIYLCNDDFSNMVSNPLSRLIVAKQESKVAARADMCLAVSYPLVSKLKSYNRNTQLFLPGHEFNTKKAVFIKEKINKIKVAFMGYIDNRLEFDWLFRAARQPDIDIHLIGPIEGVAPDIREQLSKSDILLHKPLYGENLQNFLETMDLLVIPYKTDSPGVAAITASNKLFKYLALGKPVLISNMPNFIRLDTGVIYRATSASSFVKQIRTAHKDDNSDYVKVRLRIAEENSWEKRGIELKSIIEKNL